jgi:hypothetical protein
MRFFRYELFADYSQFYLHDQSSLGEFDGSCWTAEAVDRMLAVAPGTVAVGTVRNMDVPVTVEVLDGEPGPDLSEWDHVTECSLEVPSGCIVVAGCTDELRDAGRIDVSPGSYRARVSYGALDTLSEDGLDGDDHYRVQLWPAPLIGPRVLKCRASGASQKS